MRCFCYSSIAREREEAAVDVGVAKLNGKRATLNANGNVVIVLRVVILVSDDLMTLFFAISPGPVPNGFLFVFLSFIFMFTVSHGQVTAILLDCPFYACILLGWTVRNGLH